jgi:hypothetical protein
MHTTFLLHNFKVAVVGPKVYKLWVTQNGNRDEPMKDE